MNTPGQDPSFPVYIGSLDSSGAGDHDEPYRFGRRPSARAPFPFTERQYARLLVFRSRLSESLATRDPATLTCLDCGLLETAA